MPRILGLAIPLYNEAEGVEAVVSDLVGALEAGGVAFHLALVDNGSTDGTGEILARLANDPRIQVVSLRPNQGYGGGILAGLAALPAEAEVLGWTWGDGQIDPAVVPALFALCQGEVMLAKVRRVERQDGWRRRWISRGYAAVLRLGGVATPDVNGCPKLLPREVLRTLDPQHRDWFLDAEVVLGVEARGGKVASLPVVMRPRRTGRSKVRAGTVLEFARNLVIWKFGPGRGEPV